MDLAHAKRTVASGWILAAGVVGFAANVSSVTAWIFFAAVAFGPPLMLLLWQSPLQTMSESIQEARR